MGTINVSKKTVRTSSPPPAPLSTATPTAPVLAPIKHSGYGRVHNTQKSSFSNQVDLIGKRADRIASGSKLPMYSISLADGLEFIRSMLSGGGSSLTLADAVRAAKSADIDPYGRKARFHSTFGDGWVGSTENWREKVRKWELEELTQLEEEQNKRRATAFHEWEERMGEAELMESGRADRIKQLQKEWADAEVKFREEAMDAERDRLARLNAKTVQIEELDIDGNGDDVKRDRIDVGEEAKRIKEQKEAERKAALAQAETERLAREKQAAEEEKARKEAERKRKEEEERKKIAEREAALKREAEERKRIDEEEKRKKQEEEERIAREKREEEERIAKAKREEEERIRAEEERIRKEEEERVRKEQEEAERLKREEEERLRKEEEERLRRRCKERLRKEEETAKKFGLSGFGSFG